MHSVRAACTLDAVRQRRGQCCDDDDGDATAAARSEATAAWQALSTALSRVARGFGDDDATATAIASRVIAGDERVAWAAALRRVADTATCHRIALAQLLTRALFDAFAPALQRFARAMVRSTHDMHTTAFARASHGRRDVGDDRMRCACVALRRVYDDYVRVQPLLHDMDECLHAPGATDEFTALLRGALLQPDVASGAPSPVTVALLAFVRAHAHALLAQHDRRNSKSNHDNDDDNDDSNDDDDNNDDDDDAMMTTTTHEAVLRCLHGLTLSSAPSVRRVWRETLSRCLDARVAAALASSDYAVPHLQACLAWTSSVVESFVRQTLATPSATAPSSSSRMRCATRRGHARPRRDRSSSCDDDDGDAGAVMAWRGWRVRVRQMLLHHYARLRMANVWDVLVDYPDSLPALAELRCCLQACGHRGRALQRRLVRTLRDVLATRLHCAGTRTEHVVVVLCKTVQSLCALLPRSEQSAVIFDVVSDTLRQLRARADSVATVVRCIADVSSDTSLFRTRVDDAAAAATSTTTVSAAAMAASMAVTHGLDDDDGSSSSKASSDVDDDDDDDDVSDADGRHDANNNNSSSSSSSMATAGAIGDVHRRPDVLRVLLTAVPARLLTHEYARVLAEQLLSRAPHSFDTTLAEEVHERLRCVLGQHALRSCGVMLQDIQHSRRVTQQLREYAVVVATKATTTTTRRRRRRPPSSSSRPYDDERHGQRDGSGSDGERSGSEETGRGAMCIGTPVAMTAAVSPSSPLSRTATTRASTGHGYTKTNSSSSDDDEDDDGGSDVSRIQASVDVLSLSAWPRLASLQARMAAAADAASRASLRRGSSVARHEQPTRALSYTPHPLLHRYMAQLARGYAAVKARRTLVWLLAHCRVELELLQQQQQQQQQQMPAPPPTATRPTSSSAAASSSCVWAPHTLSLLAASIVLWVRDLSSSSEATTTEQETTTTARRVRVCDVAERLGVSLAMLQPHVRALMPTVLVDCGVVRDDDESGSEAACVALQTHVVATMTTTTTATTTTTTIASPSSTMVCFDDLVAPQPSSTSMHARAAATAHTAASTTSLHDNNNDNDDDDGEVVAGVSAAQLRMLELMVPARLKTCDGATTLSEIHNSMKRFAQFTGTAADMRKILQRFVAQGKLSVSADGKLYTLPTA